VRLAVALATKTSIITPVAQEPERKVRACLAQLSFTCRVVFLENNSTSNFMTGGESHVFQLHHVLNSVSEFSEKLNKDLGRELAVWLLKL
jgi:hypothetical protein